MYYGNSYCVTVMYVCCMLWFRCVIHNESNVFLVTHVAVLECSGTTIFVHVLRFSVLIDSTVQSITYYLLAYVLSRPDKIVELPV